MKNPNCNLYELHNCPYADGCRRNFVKIDSVTIPCISGRTDNAHKVWDASKKITTESIIWVNRTPIDSLIYVCQLSRNIETFYTKENRGK